MCPKKQDISQTAPGPDCQTVMAVRPPGRIRILRMYLPTMNSVISRIGSGRIDEITRIEENIWIYVNPMILRILYDLKRYTIHMVDTRDISLILRMFNPALWVYK